MRPLWCYCWARSKKTAQRTPNLNGIGWKQIRRDKLRLFESDDEDVIAPTTNEEATVEEAGCESGDERD